MLAGGREDTKNMWRYRVSPKKENCSMRNILQLIGPWRNILLGGESHNEFVSPNAKKNMQLVAKVREGCIESIGYTWNATGNGFFPHTPSIFSQQGSKTS